VHDETLHTNPGLNSNFPIPDVPADDAWDKMNTLLDGTIPPTSVPPKNGGGNGMWWVYIFGLICLMGFVGWWFFAKEQHKNGSVAKNNSNQAGQVLPVNNDAGNQRKEMPVSGTDTAAFKNNTAPVTADSNMAATTSNATSNKYPVNTKNNKGAHLIEKITTKNITAQPTLLRAGNVAVLPSTSKPKVSKDTARNHVITAGVSHPSQQNNYNKIGSNRTLVANSKTYKRHNKTYFNILNNRQGGKNESSVADDKKVFLSDKATSVNKTTNGKDNRQKNATTIALKQRRLTDQRMASGKLPNDKNDNNNNSSLSIANRIKWKARQKIKITIHPPLPFDVSDSIAIAKAGKNNLQLTDNKVQDVVAAKQKNKKNAAKSSKDNLSKMITAGLQWNFNVPVNSGYYFTGATGKSQPWQLLLPSLWASKKAGIGRLMVSFTLLQQNLTGKKVLSSSTDTSYITISTSVIKTFGLGAGLQYNIAITPAFSVSAGFNYNTQSKALLVEDSVSVIQSVMATSSVNVANTPSNGPAYLKPSFITGKIEFAYTRAKFDVGINVQKPLTNLSSASNVNIKPVSAQVFFRWKIKRG